MSPMMKWLNKMKRVSLVWITAYTVILAMAVACSGGSSHVQDETRLQLESRGSEVDVVILSKSRFNRQVVSNGKVTAARKCDLSFRNAGVISKVNVKNGQLVNRDQIIAELDNTETLAAVESASIAMDKAELDLLDVLAGQGYAIDDTSSVPDNVMKMAKVRSGWNSARHSLDKAVRQNDATVLRAPFSGRIANLKASPWNDCGKDPICSLVDASSVNVEFYVLESEFSQVHVGLPVRVSPFGGSIEATGTVVSVNPMVDKNGQILVTAGLKGNSGLVDGMNVRIIVEHKAGEAVAVPRSAVVIRDGREVVFRYRHGRAEWVYVHVLESNSSLHSIAADEERGAVLAIGDSIIVSGNMNLADGSEVRLR